MMAGTMSEPLVTVEHTDRLAWVTINNPPVNATSADVRQGLAAAVEQVATLPVRAAVLRCAERTFVAGGDISEFDAPPVLPDLPDVIASIETSLVPWVAAMHGSVFGGGLEIALGCAWRIAVPGTRFALPEVTLGIVPGAAGTQRLPRLIGVSLAADMTTLGQPVSTEAFQAAGGLDAVVPDLDPATVQPVVDAFGPRPDPVSQRQIFAPTSQWWADKARQVEAEAAGADAPMENLALVKRATEVPFEVGQPEERARHLTLRISPQSRALRHVFFAERQVAKTLLISGRKAPPVSTVMLIGTDVFADKLRMRMTNAGLTVVSASDASANADLVLSTADDAQHLPKNDPNLPTAMAFDVNDCPSIIPETQSPCLGFGSSGTAMVEIMVSDATSASDAEACLALAKRLGHLPVFTHRAQGFVSAQIASALRQHARKLVSHGIEARHLANIWAKFGGTDTPFGTPDFKSGDDRALDPNDTAILHRLLAAMTNAGAQAIENKAVDSAATIDVIGIAQCGFPRWRGGPMHSAETASLPMSQVD